MLVPVCTTGSDVQEPFPKPHTPPRSHHFYIGIIFTTAAMSIVYQQSRVIIQIPDPRQNRRHFASPTPSTPSLSEDVDHNLEVHADKTSFGNGDIMLDSWISPDCLSAARNR
jgi:hypothetical protein